MKYYYISIGGSGAMVLEPLAHLAAAGLLPNEAAEIKVLTIDPDSGNGNLSRSSKLLNSYTKFSNIKIGNTPLFRMQIKHFGEWDPLEKRDNTLDAEMNYQWARKTPQIAHLYEMLYTRQERDMVLNEGFRGRPAIGAAVLAKDSQSIWGKFVEDVQDAAINHGGAKIFLAGSVFGGTGAAGMPTIAKLLRTSLKNQPQVSIGGVLVLPYFSLPPATGVEKDEIFASSKKFLPNTKAALTYYYERIIQDRLYDVMYFVGDSDLHQVTNFSVGAKSQENPAHIVDLYGALAAVDFYSKNKTENSVCRFIARSSIDTFEWEDFPYELKIDGNALVKFRERFSQFARFIFVYLHQINPLIEGFEAGTVDIDDYPWLSDHMEKEDFKRDREMILEFRKYAVQFIRWLGQIEGVTNAVRKSGGAADGQTVDMRTRQLINATTFSFDESFDPMSENTKGIHIHPDQFKQFVYGVQSSTDINEIVNRLAVSREPRDVEVRGFGRFLRLLYDCCE